MVIATISSKYQVVIPEDVRSLLKIQNIEKDTEGYIYFYKEGEDIKIRAGQALDSDKPAEIRMRGRDLMTGLPREVIVNALVKV